MSRFTLLLLVVPALCLAQPADMFQHLYWSAKGNRINQQLGHTKLNYLGKLNDTTQHAVAIGEVTGSYNTDPRQNIAGLCYNNGEVDTTRHFEFPGEQVVRCNINGDEYPDYVVWSETSRRISVLFGTPLVNSFIYAHVFQEAGRFDFNLTGLVVADCNGDGYDDLVVSDMDYVDSLHVLVGRELFYKGGPNFDSIPADSLIGREGDRIGGTLIVAHVRDASHEFLCEHRFIPNSGTGRYFHKRIFLSSLGPNFRLQPTDTIYCTYDSVSNGQLAYGGYSFDVDADSVEDIVMAAGGVVMAYKGGSHIDSLPTYYFTTPFPNGTTTYFGSTILDVGDISAHGYHSMLVTDPEANGVNGAIYIYNIGKHPKDSCVAYAFGPPSYFGEQAIAIGDANSDGLADIMVSSSAQDEGEVFVFLGDPSYGSPTEVVEHESVPSSFDLQQNYPNPFSRTTQISFSTDITAGGHSTAQLRLYDVLGREVKMLFNDHVEQGRYVVHVDGSKLPEGSYYYRLCHEGKEIVRRLNIVH